MGVFFGLIFGLAALSFALDFGDNEHTDREEDVDPDEQTSRNFIDVPEDGDSVSATTEDDIFLVDGADARVDDVDAAHGTVYDFDVGRDVIAIGDFISQDSGESSTESNLSLIRIEEDGESGGSLVNFEVSTPEGSLDSEYVLELPGVSGLDGANFGLMGVETTAGPVSGYSTDNFLIGEDALAEYGVEIVYDKTDIGTDGVDDISCHIDTDAISPNEHEIHEYLGFDTGDSISITLPPDFSGDIIQIPAREVMTSDGGTATFSEQYIIVRPGYLEDISRIISANGLDAATAVSIEGVYAVVTITSGPVPLITTPVLDESGEIVGENSIFPYWDYLPKIDLMGTIDRVLL